MKTRIFLFCAMAAVMVSCEKKSEANGTENDSTQQSSVVSTVTATVESMAADMAKAEQLAEQSAPAVDEGKAIKDFLTAAYKDYASDPFRKMDRYYTKSLSELWKKADATEDYWLEYAPWIDAQDFDKISLQSVEIVSIKGDEAEALARVRIYKGEKPRKVQVKLKKENGEWKIDDIGNPIATVRAMAESVL